MADPENRTALHDLARLNHRVGMKVDGRTVSEWAEELKRSGVREREAAARALITFGRCAIPAILEVMRGDGWMMQCWAAYALRKIGDDSEEVIEALKKLCMDHWTRDEALKSLSTLLGDRYDLSDIPPLPPVKSDGEGDDDWYFG